MMRRCPLYCKWSEREGQKEEERKIFHEGILTVKIRRRLLELSNCKLQPGKEKALNSLGFKAFEKEQADLKQSAEELRGVVTETEAQAVNVQNFLKIVKKYTEPTELTPALLREFVEKVVVHAPDKSSGHRTQRIDVHY